jgi:hypothetical protein
VCRSVWAVDFFSFVNCLVTFYAGMEHFASVAISAEHFFTSIFNFASETCFVWATELIMICNIEV